MLQGCENELSKKRAGWSFRVHRFNRLLIMLLDDAAADFQGRRQFAIVLAEGGGNQAKSGDRFDVGMAAVKLAQALLKEVADATVIGDRFMRRRGKPEACELVGELFEVGHDEGGQMLAAVADYAGLRHVTVGHQFGFRDSQGRYSCRPTER